MEMETALWIPALAMVGTLGLVIAKEYIDTCRTRKYFEGQQQRAMTRFDNAISSLEALNEDLQKYNPKLIQ